MNELQFFKNPEFGKIRTLELGGEPWFVGKDVAQALGYSNPRKALADHVDDEDKQNCQNDSFETPRGMTIINESVHIDGNGCNRITRTPKLTGKGQEYFIEKFLHQKAG